MKNVALKYLLDNEWTINNAQCHDCYGNRPRIGWHTDTVGHKPSCKKAKAIVSLGGKVVWEHKNHSRRKTALIKHFKEILEEK